MCLYYQDELGRCFIDGFIWGNWFAMPWCIEDDTDEKCSRKFTLKEAEKYRDKINKILEFLRNAPVAPEFVPDEIMKIIVEPTSSYKEV